MTTQAKTLNALLTRGNPESFQAQHRPPSGESVDVVWTGFESPHVLVDVGEAGGASSVFVLDRAQLDALLAREVPIGEARAVLGRHAARLEDVSPRGPAPFEVPPVKVPTTTPEQENSVQTKPEGTIFKSPELMKAVERTVTQKDFCKRFAVKDLTNMLIMDLPDVNFNMRPLPVARETFNCLPSGELVLTKSVIWMYDNIFTGKPGGRLIIDDYDTSVELMRNVFAKEIFKSTKIGFGLTVGLFPTLDPSKMDPKSAEQKVKQGDPVYDKGEPKKETPSSRVVVSFDGEFLKQYYKATLSATFRYKLVHRVTNRSILEAAVKP